MQAVSIDISAHGGGACAWIQQWEQSLISHLKFMAQNSINCLNSQRRKVIFMISGSLISKGGGGWGIMNIPVARYVVAIIMYSTIHLFRSTYGAQLSYHNLQNISVSI